MDTTAQEVIATFIVDWPLVGLIGVVFGAFAGPGAWWRSRAFAGGAVTAAAFTTVALISYSVAPEWMWMYYVDPDRVSWAVWIIAPGYMAAFALGFAGAAALVRSGRRYVLALGGLLAAAEGALLAVTWDRYHLVGTRAEWTAGAAHELLTTAPSGEARTIALLGPVFLVVGAVAFFSVVGSRRGSRRG